MLELFSGVGGWGSAWGNVVGVESILSVDHDSTPCQLLALKRKTIVSSIEQLICSEGPTEVDILQGDVADPRWWITTLVEEPFEWIAWSSPCVSFSKAGWMTGLLSPEGVLLLKAIGLFSVFGCRISLGENVFSLASHVHWKLIQSFAAHFGNWCAIDINLARIAPMQRPRLFMVQTEAEGPIDSKKLKEWVDIALQDARIRAQLHHVRDATHCLTLEPTLLPLLKDPLLCFNPRFVDREKRMTYGHGLAERIFNFPGEILPVVMASYGRQHKLPRDLLEKKGLLTWLVSDSRLGGGLRSVRYLQPAEALWLLGFGLFNPWLADQNLVMKSIGNVVSPLIAGAFIAAVFAEMKQCSLLAKYRKWLGWFEKTQVELAQLRTFLRGPCFWLGKTVPPEAKEGEDKWILSWGYAFFLVRTNQNELTHQFVQEVAGFGNQFKCRSLTTFGIGSERHTGTTVWVDGTYVQVDVLGRGQFLCDPGCTVAELDAKVAACKVVHSLQIEGFAPPKESPLWALSGEETTLTVNITGPLTNCEVGTLRLILRNDIHKVVANPELKFWDAIRIATPVRCSVHTSRIWDVRKKVWVEPMDWVPGEGGEFQVDFHPVNYEFAPYGVISFPPLTTVGECLTVLNGLWFGQKATLLLTANGKTVEPAISIGVADLRGPLRVKLYGLKGGGKPASGFSPIELSDKLRDLLLEKGVPKGNVDDRAHQVYQGLGTKTLKQIFNAKDAWQALKQEASKEKIVLIGAIERQKENSSSSELKPAEEPFDAWQAWLDNRNTLRQAKAKSRERAEAPAFQLDFSFFRDTQGNKIGSVTPEELLGGVAGIAVGQVNDIAPLLPSFCAQKVTVGTSAVVVIGGDASALGSSFEDLIVPGWMNGKTVALKVAVLSTGDEPLKWDEAQKVSVDVASGNTVCLCFVYPLEAGDKWPVLQQGFDRFFKKVFPTTPEALIDHWAAAFYSKKRKVEADQAEYFHSIVRTTDKFLDTVLKSCGRHGLYLQPRSVTRGLDSRFGVVRLPGLSREEALSVQQKVGFQLGLVRTSKGFGLRVKYDRVREARKLVYPEVDISSESGEEGELRYRLLGVPEVFDRRSVKSLLRKLGWTAKVGKAVGWKTWLITSSHAPPTKTIQVGEATVVVAEETVSVKTAVVVAATEAKYKGLRAERATVAAVPNDDRVVVGALGSQHIDKIQQVKDQVRDEVKKDLETACNQRINLLESAVDELKSATVYQQNQTAAVQRDLASVQHQVSGLPDQISALCKQLQQDSDSKLKELAGEFKVSLRERDHKVESQFEEIKAMFEGATSAKTRKVADGL